MFYCQNNGSTDWQWQSINIFQAAGISGDRHQATQDGWDSDQSFSDAEGKSGKTEECGYISAFKK